MSYNPTAKRFRFLGLITVLFGLACHFYFVYREPSEDLISFISKVTANNLAETDPKSPARLQQSSTDGQAGEGVPASRKNTFTTSQRAAAASDSAEKEVVSPPEKANARRRLLETLDDGSNVAPAPLKNGRGPAGAKRGRKPLSGDVEVGVRVPTVPDAVSPVALAPPAGQPEVARVQPAGRYNFRKLRFNAKLHMVNQFQLFVDYPLSYWFAVDMDGASIPYMSANLVSILHPVFGLLAGYFIVKAATNARALGNQQSNGPSAPFEQSALAARAQSVERSPVATCSQGVVSASKHDLSALMSPSAATAVSPSVVAGSPTFDDPNEGSERNASALLAAINIKYLWLAAALFWTRNFLDTLDGVIARVQRHRVGSGPSATTMGFNGHSLDMVTDTLGVACIGVALCILLFSRTNLTVARIPSQFLIRIGMPSAYLGKSQLLSKMVVVCGLVYLALTGMCWETFMLRYANLFDQHANTNPAIFELDNNIHVRLSEFLWAWSCGDSLLTYLIVFMIFNKIWEGLQVFFFIGIPWCLALTLYSAYVWNRVILMDPTAADIVARNPEMFL